MTGASGLVGSELCAQLVEGGHSVIALVHRRRSLLRNNGQVLYPSPYVGTAPERGALYWLRGDIRKPALGIDDELIAPLAGTIDLIVHCAAETKFTPASDRHHSVNIVGTSNVISFAKACGPRPPALVHVSTAYVGGERSGPIPEDATDPGPFANSYEASKARAESLVRASALPAAIARPSIILGESDTGTIGRFESLYAFLRLIGGGRITVLPGTSDATLDLVPIDHVVGGLIDIVEHFQRAAGQTFHLVSGDPAPVAALISLDYAGLRVPRVVPPDRFDPSQLTSAERALYHSVTSAFSAYLRRNPRFLAQNLPALSGRVCPPTGHAFLRRAIQYATDAGYLVPAVPGIQARQAAYRTSG